MRKVLLIGGIVFVAILAVGFLVTKGPLDVPMPQHEKFEVPEYNEDEDIVRHLAYTASYNHETLVPDWVAWRLTQGWACAGDVNNSSYCHESFSRDPDVREPKACREDYSHSGWDKGHMAPRADMKWNLKALEESFYFTNVCPQNHEMNSGAWRKIEELCRAMAQCSEPVYIVCGPIFTDHRHGTIGKGRVQVPDAFFKALAVEVEGKLQTMGFIVDNSSQSFAPKHYAVTVDSVEHVIGRNLFPRADEAAEATIDWNFWKRYVY